MSRSMYPDGLSGSDMCHMEGCVGRGPCPRCGKTNYPLLGWYGAVARWAKVWGISEDEAEWRIMENQERTGAVTVPVEGVYP